MPFPLLIPLIAAGISAAGSIISANRQKKAQQSANRANQNLAEYSYQQQQLMTDKQNEYNSPANQLSRYAGAGLNPNLIYGNGASGGNQSSTPSYEAPTIQPAAAPLQVDGALDSFLDTQVKQAQVDNIKAQTLSTRTSTASEAIRQGLLGREDAKRAFEQEQREGLRNFNFQIKENEAQKSAASLQNEIQRLGNLKAAEIESKLRQDNIRRGYKTQDLQQESMKLRNFYDSMRNKMKENGIESADHPLVRWLFRALSNNNALPDWMK